MDLFFVLSGFLISGILFRQYQRTGQIRLGEFLVRRGFKIYPQFWAMIAVSVWFGKHSDAIPEITWSNVLVELLFVQNYFKGIWSHTWSLGVEEHCYLALAVLLAGWARWGGKSAQPFRGLTTVMILGLVAAFVIRCGMVWENPLVRFRTHQMPTHARFDNFLCGALLGYWYTFHTERFLAFAARWRLLCVFLGVALLVPNFIWFFRFRATGDLLIRNYWITTVGLTVNWMGAAALLIAACGFPTSGNKRGWLAWIGSHSYGIYLWHTIAFDQTVVPLMRSYFVSSNARLFGYVLFYLIGTILVGAFSSWLIERPALRLRDRFFPSSSGNLRIPQAKPPVAAQTATSAEAETPLETAAAVTSSTQPVEV